MAALFYFEFLTLIAITDFLLAFEEGYLLTEGMQIYEHATFLFSKSQMLLSLNYHSHNKKSTTHTMLKTLLRELLLHFIISFHLVH